MIIIAIDLEVGKENDEHHKDKSVTVSQHA